MQSSQYHQHQQQQQHHRSISQLRVMDRLQRLRQLQKEGSRMISALRYSSTQVKT
jgi:hypothetical protein